ncbi:ribosomal protein L2 [Cenarchaeum symbiosum A]|uniref:Large ribosomal subunit protein uL2 n=1 Tax=Cenarchaeum symbiosum (strain A) TaxID=414004 RepID=RL2_CENSY|nr:RecName: Full=Large ribosomal subunit protein uL2; AltName: Full=50S ribosomal protein L2 [Cenarchaeum symbiosum A]ABK78576.1 ribosomal protein L2 [Cenarchaeum symbiosum A]
MGKRPLVRRRGRGGMQFRAATTGKIARAKYPAFELGEQREGTVIDLVHERGRDAPLAKIRFEDGIVSYVPAVLGTRVGSSMNFGLKSEIRDGNVISVQNIPDGTTVCNVEKHYGDGGAIVKSAGGNATVFSHGEGGVVLKLPSGRFSTLNPKNRAMVGTLAGGGVSERPFMSAGGKWRRFRSKGRKYPIVRGVAQAAYVHPHGGGRHQHVGQSSTVSRNAPPGAKVGSIAARKTGRAKIKDRR